MLHLIRLPYVRVPLSNVFPLGSGHLPWRTEGNHKNHHESSCLRFKRGTTKIKSRIMCMTSFGISGAEALDPTTRVFVC